MSDFVENPRGVWSVFERFLPDDGYWLVGVGNTIDNAITEAQELIAESGVPEFRFLYVNVPVVVTARTVPGILRRCVKLAFKDRSTEVVGPCEAPSREAS